MTPVTVIGVAASQDPADPGSYSGTPFGVMSGLREIGLHPEPVRAFLPPTAQKYLQLGLAVGLLRPGQLPGGLRQAVRTNQSRLVASGTLARVRSRAAARNSKRRSLGDFVQFGTDFSLPAGSRYVTYDDQTVLQAMSGYDYAYLRALSGRERKRLVARQRRSYLGAVACCVGSEWAARSVIEDYGIPPERVHVVGFGATNLSRSVPDRDWSSPRFLFVGKDWERKNGDLVVTAFRKLRERVPEATLDLVGGHPAVSLPGVVQHGLLSPNDPRQQERLSQLFAGATCLVVPSQHEPAGIVYAEAGSAGVGSIGSTSGGASTLIGAGGIVVEPRKSDALLEAMLTFAGPAAAREFGYAARVRSELFTWPAVSARLALALAGGAPETL